MILAVISDIHVGIAARSQDLCPEPAATERKLRARYQAKLETQYRDDFVQFVGRNSISADYLVLPGDLTNQADPREVEIVSDFVLQAADALSVPYDRIVFVPGNHDVDWSVYDASDTTGIRWGQRYDPMRNSKFHFKHLVDQGHGTVFGAPHFSAWSFPDLLVVGYNSASHDSPMPRDDVHHGLADPAHCEEIRQYLTNVAPPDGRTRLFLAHHHVLDFTNPIPETPDFSLMTNAGGLLAILHECRFDLVVHGHKHHPRFETHGSLSHAPMPILCSGSFSVEIDTRWAGTIDNLFHLVEITGRAGSESQITGRVLSWTNNHCRGWIPSEEFTSGIHHIIPFGSYLLPNELDARLEPFIVNWLATRDHITWRDVVGNFPDLEYVPLPSAMDAFGRIAQRLGKQTMYQTLKDLMLY